MSNKPDMITNASPSAYGWCFQVGAGITLMLDNIKDFTSIKMEGKSDDIEINTPMGKIYAQAKSVTQIGNQNSASKKLQDSLKLLSKDNQNGDAIQLIYITNIANPLSSKQSSAFCYGHSYEYSILSDKDRRKIDSHIGTDFPRDKLRIYLLNFFGEGENKFASIKEKISEFLRDAIDDPSYSQKLLDSWFSTFMINCSDIPDNQKECTLTKKEIIFPVMVLVLNPLVSEEEFSKVCDYDDIEELQSDFRTSIDRKVCDYQFVSGVIGDFLSSRLHNGQKMTKYDFIKEKWKNYEEDFLFVVDDQEREALVKLVILATLLKKKKINQIKEAANL